MPNIVPKTMEQWMRRQELSAKDLDSRRSDLIAHAIADGVSLDDFLWSGRYFRESETGTTTALGYPLDGSAGTLEVVRNPASIQAQQIFHDRVSGVSWIRWYNGLFWGDWTSGSTDSGWVAITDFEPGFAPMGGDNTPMVRRYGPVVAVRGRADYTGGVPTDGTFAVCTVPSGFAPPAIWDQARARNMAAPPSRMWVNTAGVMTIGTAQGATTIILSAMWMLQD